MTPQGVADRLRKVGTEGGVVMLVWHNKVDARTFLKDDRKSPQGEEPAEKRIKATWVLNALVQCTPCFRS